MSDSEMPLSLDVHLDAWREAVRDQRRGSARSHADTILDAIKYLGHEPRWSPTEKRDFLNWCDRQGLLRK